MVDKQSSDEQNDFKKFLTNKNYMCSYTVNQHEVEIKFANIVLAREHFRCQICRTRKNPSGRRLVAHHLDDIMRFPSKVFNPDNGACVCISCHTKYHGWTRKGKKYRVPSTRLLWERYIVLQDIIKLNNRIKKKSAGLTPHNF